VESDKVRRLQSGDPGEPAVSDSASTGKLSWFAKWFHYATKSVQPSNAKNRSTVFNGAVMWRGHSCPRLAKKHSSVSFYDASHHRGRAAL
jgi:hypothetical protein